MADQFGNSTAQFEETEEERKRRARELALQYTPFAGVGAFPPPTTEPEPMPPIEGVPESIAAAPTPLKDGAMPSGDMPPAPLVNPGAPSEPVYEPALPPYSAQEGRGAGFNPYAAQERNIRQTQRREQGLADMQGAQALESFERKKEVANLRKQRDLTRAAEMESLRQERELQLGKAAQARAKELENEQLSIDETEEEVRKAQDDYANYQLDPWKSTNKGVAALAIVLGGIGQGISGRGPNAGLQVVMRSIDKELARQQAELGKLGQTARDKKFLYSQMVSTSENNKEAYHKSRYLMIEDFQRRLQEASGKTTNQDVQIRAKEAMDILEDTKNSETQKIIASKIQSKYQRQTELNTIAAQKFQAAQRAEEANRSPVAGMALTGEVTPSKDDIKYMRQTKASFSSLMADMNDLRSHVEGTGTVPSWTTKGSIGVTMARHIQMILKDPENYNLGVLSGPDLELLESIVGSDPGQINTSSYLAKLGQAQKILQRKFYHNSRQRGFKDLENPYSDKPMGEDTL